jgi:hypothetical protein
MGLELGERAVRYAQVAKEVTVRPPPMALGNVRGNGTGRTADLVGKCPMRAR